MHANKIVLICSLTKYVKNSNFINQLYKTNEKPYNYYLLSIQVIAICLQEKELYLLLF